MRRRELAAGNRIEPIPLEAKGRPAGYGTADFENGISSGQSDYITDSTLQRQARHVIARFGFTSALAIVIASAAYGCRP